MSKTLTHFPLLCFCDVCVDAFVIILIAAHIHNLSVVRLRDAEETVDLHDEDRIGFSSSPTGYL